MSRILLIVLLGLFLSIARVSLLYFFPAPISVFDPLLVAAIILIFIFDLKTGLILAVFGGLILEFFSSLPFGLLAGSMILALFSLDFLAREVFTNRSLWALIILGFLGTLIYKIILLILYLLISLKIKTLPLLSVKGYFWLTWEEAFFNSLVLALVYLIYQKIKKGSSQRI